MAAKFAASTKRVEDARRISRIQLGQRVRALRQAQGKTLREIGLATKLANSTISKIETGALSVSYDNLIALAHALGVEAAELLATAPPAERQAGTPGRRSITRSGSGETYDTGAYSCETLCGDLAHKRMITLLATLNANSSEPTTSFIRHAGEEFVYVLDGAVELRTDLYHPLRLATGDSFYFDSTMAHALVTVGDTPARVLWVTTGSDD